MNKQQAKLLLDIADCAENTPDEEWNMQSWSNMGCGCAIGTADRKGVLEGSYLCILNYGSYCKPVYGDHMDYEAIAAAISISYDEAKSLFYPYQDDPQDRNTETALRDDLDQKATAERIRKFVKAAYPGMVAEITPPYNGDVASTLPTPQGRKSHADRRKRK